MGVPKFLSWLNRRIKGITSKCEFEEGVDCLYLDFNALIHESSLHYCNSSKMAERRIERHLPLVLDKILEQLKPKKLLYIGVDGTAPIAKLNQQRERRYAAALDKKLKTTEIQEEEFLEEKLTVSLDGSRFQSNFLKEYDDYIIDKDDLKFSRCSITPGTSFMERMHLFIESWIRNKLSTDQRLKDLIVIYSSYKVPGEGEQKILNYIRNNKNRRKYTHAVYSPDGDMIFLALTVPDVNIHLLRMFETIKKDDKLKNCSLCGRNGHLMDECESLNRWKLRVINVRLLKNYVLNSFNRIENFEIDKQAVINDWIFCCFLMGNDFVPNIQCCHIDNDAIDRIIKALRINLNQTKKYITNGDSVDFEVFGNFLNILRTQEIRYNIIWSDYLKTNSEEDVEEFDLSKYEGRKQYYMQKMGTSSSNDVYKACGKYLKCLAKNFRYYMSESHEWRWFYPYHFAPFLADLCKMDMSEIKTTPDNPMGILAQLLLVTPPMEKHLVPLKLASIYQEKSFFYPNDVKTDMFGTIISYQKKVILPFSNIGNVLENFSDRINELEYKDIFRNVTSTPTVFTARKDFLNYGVEIYDNQTDDLQIDNDFLNGKLVPDPFTVGYNETTEYIAGETFCNKTMSFNLKN